MHKIKSEGTREEKYSYYNKIIMTSLLTHLHGFQGWAKISERSE